DRQMLVHAQVVDDPATSLAEDHVRVKPPGPWAIERANPGHRLPAEGIDERVVLDREGHLGRLFREHDPTPRADVQERQRPRRSPPYLVHHAVAHRGDAIAGGEAKAPRDLRV